MLYNFHHFLHFSSIKLQYYSYKETYMNKIVDWYLLNNKEIHMIILLQYTLKGLKSLNILPKSYLLLPLISLRRFQKSWIPTITTFSKNFNNNYLFRIIFYNKVSFIFTRNSKMDSNFLVSLIHNKFIFTSQKNNMTILIPLHKCIAKDFVKISIWINLRALLLLLP